MALTDPGSRLVRSAGGFDLPLAADAAFPLFLTMLSQEAGPAPD